MITLQRRALTNKFVKLGKVRILVQKKKKKKRKENYKIKPKRNSYEWIPLETLINSKKRKHFDNGNIYLKNNKNSVTEKSNMVTNFAPEQSQNVGERKNEE